MTDELKDALLEFVQKLHGAGIRVFLGGGYGLYVRQISLLGSPVRTYLNAMRGRDRAPPPTSTSSCRRRSSSTTAT